MLEKNVPTLESYWLKILPQKNIAQNTANVTWNSLNNHLFPKLSKHPITALTPVILIDAMKPIANKDSLLLKDFEAPKKQCYATIKPEELPKLMADFSSSTLRLVTRLLIEWQLHTMVRSNEAATAR